MALPDRRHILRRGVPVFLATYVGVITLVVMATYDWFPILSGTFCGSLGDFTDEPVAAVCLSFSTYWFHAALHPPYLLASTVVGILFGTVSTYRGSRQ